MGLWAAVVLSVGLQTSPVYLSRPIFNPALCAKKRVDPCGCHHIYGIRHCHPNRKGNHCEAPACGQAKPEPKPPGGGAKL